MIHVIHRTLLCGFHVNVIVLSISIWITSISQSISHDGLHFRSIRFLRIDCVALASSLKPLHHSSPWQTSPPYNSRLLYLGLRPVTQFSTGTIVAEQTGFFLCSCSRFNTESTTEHSTNIRPRSAIGGTVICLLLSLAAQSWSFSCPMRGCPLPRKSLGTNTSIRY